MGLVLTEYDSKRLSDRDMFAVRLSRAFLDYGILAIADDWKYKYQHPLSYFLCKNNEIIKKTKKPLSPRDLNKKIFVAFDESGEIKKYIISVNDIIAKDTNIIEIEIWPSNSIEFEKTKGCLDKNENIPDGEMVGNKIVNKEEVMTASFMAKKLTFDFVKKNKRPPNLAEIYSIQCEAERILGKL